MHPWTRCLSLPFASSLRARLWCVLCLLLPVGLSRRVPMARNAISYVCQSPPPETVSRPASGSNSPQISKASSFHKQRSSSLNSASSTHLTRQRSMSIVSLESPRNSIVSTDDFPTKPTRNNSNSSLSSMNALISSAAASPVDLPTYAPSLGKPPKVRAKTLGSMGKNACAIISDDEFSELELMIRSLRWRRSSGERPPGLTPTLKRDFHFKSDSSKHRSPILSSQYSPNGLQKLQEDLVPSPLSICEDGAPSQGTLAFQIRDDHSGSKQSPFTTSVSKKTKTSNISHSMFLKKKLLFSKDVQFELPSGQLPGLRTTVFHSEPLASPTHTSSELFAYSHHSIFPLVKSPHTNVADGHFLHARPSSPVNPPFANVPHELTLRQQNKLISDLNRKWNKSLFPMKSSDFSHAMTHPSDSITSSHGKQNKRARSELVSSTDSLNTNIL